MGLAREIVNTMERQDDDMAAEYEVPMVEEIGTLHELTLGSSFSSTGDALLGIIPIPGGNPTNVS
ncbi:MAG: lasso RiPP family leader peptide-containing protein [Egibacteraceae bacterium]